MSGTTPQPTPPPIPPEPTPFPTPPPPTLPPVGPPLPPVTPPPPTPITPPPVVTPPASPPKPAPTGGQATSYHLIGSASIVQVLSPTVVVDQQAVTIQTIPSGVIATTLVDEVFFQAGTAGPIIKDFADSIESVMRNGKATGGTGTTALDASGLMAYFVTFTVAYNPPGSPAGTVTTDADVPVTLLTGADSAQGYVNIAQANAIIDAAYANLVALSNG